jgi:GxxExxY protein
MQTDEKMDKSEKLIHSDLTYKIIGLFFKVHTQLGYGFPEKIYQRALELELQNEGLGYSTEKEIKVLYNKKIIGSFRLDLVIAEKVIIEIKALEYLPKVAKEQLVSYLKATPYEVGLLANFGTPKLEYIRMARKN